MKGVCGQISDSFSKIVGRISIIQPFAASIVILGQKPETNIPNIDLKSRTYDFTEEIIRSWRIFIKIREITRA